jgi:integrase
VESIAAILKAAGRHMSRTRHQKGWVEETGKRVRKWKGHFYVYVRQSDGTEKRQHRAVILGLKSEMRKWEAERKLRPAIEQEAGETRPSSEYTLGWFWRNRYRPLKEPRWKPSSAPKMVWFIENYVIKPFANLPLGGLNRFEIQSHLNSLAGKFSRSVVLNFRTYIKAVLDEAMEQDFIVKNPARKLEIPKTRKASKRALAVEEISALLHQMDGRDRLVLRMFLVLGLRPGELFALRRNDRVASNSLRIDESISPVTGIVAPKTEASCASVWLPQSLMTELDFWMESQADQRPEAFLFPSEAGTPIAANNWLKRTLKRAARKVREKMEASGVEVPAGFLEGVTNQALRRTCATQMQHLGSVKDIQSHLRHARPNITAEVYIQEIPASVRTAVELLDQKLCGFQHSQSGGSIEPN